MAKKGKREWPLIVAFLAAFAVFAVSAGMLIRYYVDSYRSENSFSKLSDIVAEDASGSEENDLMLPENSGIITPAKKYEEVYKLNPDFIGWIKIDGTVVDYPVLQKLGDRDYYLKRDFYGKSSSHGTPYADDKCTPGKSDNVIIYGHDMKDGSMFASLLKYRDESFFKEHGKFQFDTLDEYGEYEIMAVFTTTVNAGGFKYYDFITAENEEAYDEFVRQCKSLSLYETGVTAEYGDKLVTLSTCDTGRGNDRRFVVVGRKIQNMKNPVFSLEDVNDEQ